MVSVNQTELFGVITEGEKTENEIRLRLLKTQSYNGIMDLVYSRR